MEPGNNHSQIPELTSEETTIIDLLYRGHTQEAIGRKLGVKDRTIRRRLKALKAKLGAENSLQIPLKAQELEVWAPSETTRAHHR